MAKKLVLTLEGIPSSVDAALDSFVRQYGWTEDTKDSEGNPVTKEAKATEVIRQYLLDSVIAYNVDAAKKAAETAARTQTEQRFVDDTDLTLTTVEE